VDFKDKSFCRAALSLAAVHGHEQVVELLIASRGDINSSQRDTQNIIRWSPMPA